MIFSRIFNRQKPYISISLNNAGLDEDQSRRLSFAASYYREAIELINGWITTSREPGNFTYDLGNSNKLNLASIISFVTGTDFETAHGYIREIEEDTTLRDTILTRARSEKFMDLHDTTALFGRRIGWYAMVRITKPKVVVETGVDKGLGSSVLCAALLRNEKEGFPGRYYGTDIMPGAGYLLTEPYAQMGEILYGDSIQTLSNFKEKIDLFINDSDHSADYETQEYETIAHLLSDKAVIMSDNGQRNVFAWSQKIGRSFVFFQEQPLRHWYPGAGITFSFPRRS